MFFFFSNRTGCLGSLILSVVLSLIGVLIGLIVTTTALGGLAPWSRWQFVGAFGVLEAASGLSTSPTT